MSNCEKKTVNGNWLTNGELETCLLKLAPPTTQEMDTDTTRPVNIKMLKKLISTEKPATKSLLERTVHGRPVLVLAPELAFGSNDYDELAQLISEYAAKIIFISGFGFTSGETLNRLAQLEEVIPVWQGELNDDAKYNCGWIWVKDNQNTITCHIFLKNYLEQSGEITIPRLEVGESILRLETDDLILFPLICADLISSLPDSPREAIKVSLRDSHPAHRKVIITGSLYATNSSSDRWKTSIGDILNNDNNPRMLLCNGYVPYPITEELKDMWRCLSGAYQKRTASSKPPEIPLPYVRFVHDTMFCGFILRCSEAGCAFGPIRWTNDSALGKYVWAPSFRYISHHGELIPHDGYGAADELYRFIHRFKGTIYEKAGYSEAAQILATASIGRILEELRPSSSSSLRRFAEQLFTRCLLGVRHSKQKIDFEKLYDEGIVLDCALTTLLLIKDSLNSTLLPEDKSLEYGQLLLEDAGHEILVWKSINYPGKGVYELIASGIVKDGGSARPLTIIGCGNGTGSEPISGRLRSTRLDDTTAPSPTVEIEVCDSRDRVVYWKQLGEIGDIFASESTAEAIKQSVKAQIRLEGTHG